MMPLCKITPKLQNFHESRFLTEWEFEHDHLVNISLFALQFYCCTKMKWVKPVSFAIQLPGNCKYMDISGLNIPSREEI